MFPRFVTKSIHAYLDYPVAFALMILPNVLNLGAVHPMAYWLSVTTGAAAFVLTVLTDHHLGVFRILSYRVHLTVDLMVGLTFLAAPLVIGFQGIEFWYYTLNGAAVLVVVGLHKPESDPVPAE